MKITKKSVLFQNNWNLYGWAAKGNWDAEPGTVLASNGIEIQEDKANATFSVRGEWVESVDTKAPHAVRVIRAGDGEIVCETPKVTGRSGFVSKVAVADVIAGEIYRVEFYSDSAQPGTIVSPKGGFFGSTPGTYLEIV